MIAWEREKFAQYHEQNCDGGLNEVLDSQCSR